MTGINGNGVAHRPTFDWSINLGHVLTIISLVGMGFLGWTSLQVRLSELDARTTDYAAIRDLARDNDIRIDSLRPLIISNTETTRQILATMADMREDLAAIRASLRQENPR